MLEVYCSKISYIVLFWENIYLYFQEIKEKINMHCVLPNFVSDFIFRCHPMHHLIYIMSAFREINDFMHRNIFYDSLALKN